MLSKRQLDKLNKTELVAYALNLSDLHEKFSTLEKSLTDSIVAIEKDFKEQFELYKVRTNAIIDDLTSQLEVSKNTSTVLRDDLLNEHLSPYYSKLRYVSKLLKERSLINDFWVSGHKLKIKTSDDEVKIISHKDDLLIYSEGDITVILNAM